MIGHQIALIRRELWEHRAIFVTPAAIAISMSVSEGFTRDEIWVLVSGDRTTGAQTDSA